VFSGHTEGQDNIRRMTTEERRANAFGRKWPLEARQDPKTVDVRRRLSRAIGDKNRELYAAGKWSPPRPRDLSAAGQRGGARKRELVHDPEYRAWLAQRISEERVVANIDLAAFARPCSGLALVDGRAHVSASMKAEYELELPRPKSGAGSLNLNTHSVLAVRR
jgi:hypothetical protein